MDLYEDHRKYFAYADLEGKNMKHVFELQGSKITEYRYNGKESEKLFQELINQIAKNTELLKKNLDILVDRRRCGSDWITCDFNETTGIFVKYSNVYLGEMCGSFCAGHGCEHNTKDVYADKYTPYTFPIHLFYIYELFNTFFGRALRNENNLSYNKEIFNKLVSQIEISSEKESIIKDLNRFLNQINYIPSFKVECEPTTYYGEYEDCCGEVKTIYLEKRVQFEDIKFETIKDLLYFSYDLKNDFMYEDIKKKIIKYLESNINCEEINIKDVEIQGDEFLIQLFNMIKEESEWFNFYKEIKEYIYNINLDNNYKLQRKKQ